MSAHAARRAQRCERPCQKACKRAGPGVWSAGYAFPPRNPAHRGSSLMPEPTEKPGRSATGAEEDFGALFERSLKSPKQGEVVTGRVVLIGRDVVTVDIGYKSEGHIPIREFTGRDGHIGVQEGDDIDVYFEATDTESGDIVLSRQKAEQFKVWREIEQAFERDGAVDGTI